MSPYKCLIVDDEPIARRIVKGYLAPLPNYEVVAEAGSAYEALGFLGEHAIDLLFLDIRMQGLDGLGFLRVLKSPPKVILITAFREFALEGYSHDVIDYLLKPVSEERFLRALGKFESRMMPNEIPQTEGFPQGHIWVKSDRKNIKIELEQVLYLESQGDYILFHQEGESQRSKMKWSELETLLPSTFVRTHRSFVVNNQWVTAFGSEEVEIGSVRIPIGRSFKDEALERLRG